MILALLLSAGPGSAAGASDASLKPHPPVQQSHFVTSDQCLACHNGLVTESGEDISIGSDWGATMMASSARDPYWQAAVRREITDHPESSAAIQNECSACHMPMARFDMKAQGESEQVFNHLQIVQPSPHDLLALDGVSCSMCHQITPARLGEESSFTAGFVVATEIPMGSREVFGPYEIDQGRTRIMHSASQFAPTQSPHLGTSEMCATCHTLYTHSLGAGGEVIGSLPEQVPYLEWKHSDYAEKQSCQSCHMRVVEGEAAITSVLGEPRPQVRQHVFRGGNFFMMRILNRYRNELGVTASSAELENAVMRTVAHLQNEASEVELSEPVVVGEELRFDVKVRNLAGHKLPTAYPSRRAWLHVTVYGERGEVIFESGAIEKDGSIRGNDNDSNARAYEPHYEVITGEDQVQIYESIMTDADGNVTTGLLSAVRFVKDNRIPPAGFDKESADEDIRVRGEAAEDPDFASGSDVVRYRVPLGAAEVGAIDVALLYQPIAYRWAQNLGAVDSMETRRFVGYYDEMAGGSWVRLGKASWNNDESGSRASVDRPGVTLSSR